MMAEAIRHQYRVTADEAHELECAIRNHRRVVARKDGEALVAADYRRRSNFLRDIEPDQRARMDAADPDEWQAFLHDADNDAKANALYHGIVAGETPRTMTTLEAVREHMAAFGWNGLTSPQVAAAIKRDKRGVDRALADLLESGEVLVKETNTRGKKASKRKVWIGLDNRPLATTTDDVIATTGDTYFAEGGDAHGASDLGTGGGRSVRPRGGAE